MRDKRRAATLVVAVAMGGAALCARADRAADADSFRLTWGGEYRFKVESLDAPNFGVRANDEAFTAVGHRGMFSADAHIGSSVRTFLQLSAAADSGRKPAERSFDRSQLDVAQAFVDVSLPRDTTLRVGRQVLDAAGNRLISTREAANLRLAFDMARADTRLGRTSFTAFYGRPVLNARDAFDDRRNPSEKFMGAWLLRPLGSGQEQPVLNVFFLSRDRARAVYQEGTASDHRRTVGARLSRAGSPVDYAFQVSGQYGSFGSDDIRAFGVAGDVGLRLDAHSAPRVGVSFGYASADDRRDDRLGTFDVIYPNLGYFTDAPVFYPGNTADVQPNVTFNLHPTLRLRIGCDVIARISKNDAVYGPPGVPLIAGNGSGSSFVAALSSVRADWTPEKHTTVTLSFVHGSTGRLIQQAGGEDFNYGAVVTSVRF
jgi:hypothetical protein